MTQGERFWKKQPLIHLENISKTYKNAAGSFTALRNINLDFYQGEFIGVIGKSGSGKSTLVNMMAGIDRPTQGTVLIGGKNIHTMKEGQQARWRGLNMGVVFQFFQLLPMLSLVENILLPMDFCEKYSQGERYERAMDLLALMGLQDAAHKLPGAVSGGQQQSAAIARALANDPPILVADEPTGNLDAKTAESVYDNFEALADEGRTIIMITHDPDIESRLSRKVLLSDGEATDPILMNTLPWLPHASLRALSHALERRTYLQGEPLDIRGELANQLMIIEKGKIKLTWRGRPHKGKTVIIPAGGFFAGPEILNEYELRQYDAEAELESTLALLTWDALAAEIKALPRGTQKFEKRLHRQMLGKKKTDQEKKGLI